MPPITDATPTVRRSGSASGSNRDRRQPLGILPEPGETLDAYEILETIGVGGMGAVFRALDQKLDRHVALKVLPLESSEDAEVVQRFYQEGRAAARLDHEGIARVYAIGSDRGFHFIAFEYIEGTNLRQLVDQRGPLKIGETIDSSLQVAAALVHAMQRGVVHRDIKPSNIIVTPEGRTKLVDMGLARRFERMGDDDCLTQTGMTLGTFDYISPEQARDPRDVDVRSDLYSLGCTMYHMLTGRPPFADGTVLQKLLQHQEEPPPDVRDLNPDVPAGLAALIQKLMAKDRNRRYQTPEQLGHDLEALSRTVGEEPSGWGVPRAKGGRSRRSARSLWAVPTALLVLVAAGVFWPKTETPENRTDPRVESAIPTPERGMGGALSPTPHRAERPAAESVAKADPESEPIVAQPQTVQVRNSAELAEALDDPARVAVIEFMGAGPYKLNPGVQLHDRDLILRAGEGVRPTLYLTRGTNPKRASDNTIAFLHVVGGKLQVEGIDFELESGYRDDTVAAILAENAELTVRRCVVRRPNYWLAAASRVYGLDVRATGTAETVAPIRIQSSSFEGALAGLLARGPVELRISDTTFGLTGPVVRLERNGTDRAGMATLTLKHISILANEGPVFRFLGPAPRVRIEETIVAPGAERPSTLVVAEDPDRLDWFGRDNFYGRIATYLQPQREDADFPALKEFDAWADDPEAPREAGSLASDDLIWAEDHPSQFLAGPESVRAFRIVQFDNRPTRPGARQSPSGQNLTAIVASGTGRRPAAPRPAPTEPTRAIPLNGPPLIAENDPDPEHGAEPTKVAARPTEGVGAVAAQENPAVDEPAPAVISPEEHRAPTNLVVAPPDDDAAKPTGLVRDAEEFREEWKRLSPKGGTIRLAPGATIALSPLDVRGEGRWSIKSASKGAESRPRISLEMPQDDPIAFDKTGASNWVGLFRLRDGASLQCEGIDISLSLEARTGDRRWAVFVMNPGADLELNDTSVTVSGRRKSGRSAIVTLRTPEDENDAVIPGATHTRAATVRVLDSFLRAGDDGVDVSGGRRLSLTFKNALIAVGGVLLRRPLGQSSRNEEALQLGLEFNQLTCFAGGGLVYLQSSGKDVETPQVDIMARHSIFALTDSNAPLLRIDGIDDPMGQHDPIHWDGQSVAYHGVQTFRQDQSGLMNSPPVKLDRSTWRSAIGNREDAPIFGDVRFSRPVDAGQSPWTLTKEQARLSRDSPALQSGADLSRIPPPPGGE